jgi:hypothetical protein
MTMQKPGRESVSSWHVLKALYEALFSLDTPPAKLRPADKDSMWTPPSPVEDWTVKVFWVVSRFEMLNLQSRNI